MPKPQIGRVPNEVGDFHRISVHCRALAERSVVQCADLQCAGASGAAVCGKGAHDQRLAAVYRGTRCGANITALSYAGHPCLGFTVSSRPVPDVRLPADDFLLAPVRANKPAIRAKPEEPAATSRATGPIKRKFQCCRLNERCRKFGVTTYRIISDSGHSF